MMKASKDWLKIFGVVTLPLLGFWLYGLTDVDEGFYAAVVAEMNRRAEWITPFYNGKPWFEKPALLYWFAKPSLAIFGGEFGLRLPSVLATLGLYAFVAWFATRRLSRRTAQWSVLILGTCLLVVAVGRMMMTDALLCLCLSGALLTFFESLAGDRRWRLATAFLLGLSVLAKGPVGCVLFVLIAGITFWREPELRSAFRGWWLLGTLIFAATVASWYVPAYLADGRVFVQEFLVKQNLERFAGGDAAHTLHGPASWFFYAPILLIGMFPWTLWLWPAVKGQGNEEQGTAIDDQGLGGGVQGRDTRDIRGAVCREPQAASRKPQAAARFLVVWAVVVFLFFSLGGAKLPHYILPAIPPLAILVGGFFARKEHGGPAHLIPWGALATASVLCIVINAGMVAWDRGMFKGVAPQADARRLALEARRLLDRDPAAGIAIYRMGRQSRDMGTGKLKVQETDLPSLHFYLARNAPETDDFGALLGTRAPLLILTRTGRIGPEEIRASMGRLRTVRETDRYVLWYLSQPPFKRGRAL